MSTMMDSPCCSNRSRSSCGNSQRMPKRASSGGCSGDLIEIVDILRNKLAATGHNLDISLPQIVVVGCQSAGKSSVLENIVGREFLPRGSGVVTRRPTVVQLQKSEDEYAEFLHKPGEIFRSFEQVRDEIERETLREPGPVGFSSVPICLKIFSPNVLKLTLVDLPGLIRVTVGNQSEDSISAVRNMVLQYISQPNSLILAVSPANQDIANSDALEIAKTVDPERVRTIGVLTKLDLMDEGTDARNILENKSIPLKRGFIGVLNRSQRDIDEEKDFNYCLQKEKTFFESMPSYKHLADKMGTPYLKKYLNKQLYAHIKESLPALRQELSKKLAEFQKKLKDFNTRIGCLTNENYSTQFYMMKLMQKFVDDLVVEVFGYSEKVSKDGLSAGSLINYKLCTSAHKSLKLPQIPGVEELMILIANLHGMRCSLSLPSLALETVANQVLTQYIDPLNSLIDHIAETLLSTVEKCSQSLDSYPNLQNEMLYFLRNNIQDASFETKESLDKHLKAEMYFMNTYHPDFAFPEVESTRKLFPMRLWDEVGASSSTATTTHKMCDYPCEEDAAAAHSSEEDKAAGVLASNNTLKENALYLAQSINKYLIIQHKLVGDTAIKYITFFLVKTVMDFVKGELIPTLLESADKESIFEDCEKDFDMLNEIKGTCECLEDALTAVQTF